jgi:ComF family protein
VAPAEYRCGQCREKPPPVDRLLAVWSYQPPLSQVILALKLRRLDYLGEALAAAALARLSGEQEGRAPERENLTAVDLVVPVPLPWRRRWVRGFNQAERIARPLAAALGVPFDEALRRIRASRTQRSLGRRRRLLGPEGTFGVRRSASVAGCRVLLVDDVVTTGATVTAAASALVAAGASAVMALALARTPEGEGPG